jgi:hypothetical protein
MDDTYLGDHECLDLTSVWYMRTDTEIYHWSTTINSGGGTIWDLGLDQVLFVSVVLRDVRRMHTPKMKNIPRTSSIDPLSRLQDARTSACL